MSLVQTFHDLHAGPAVLVLPNAWDCASAALMQEAGAAAIATSSAAVAWSRGYPDGDKLPLPVLLDVISGIARITGLPLTADIEGGFTDDLDSLADTIAAVTGTDVGWPASLHLDDVCAW